MADDAISVKNVQTLLDTLQNIQFILYATAQALNSAADDITKTVKNLGIRVVDPAEGK